MARPHARYNDDLMRGDDSFEGVRLGPVRARTVSLPPSKSAALRAIMISASSGLPVSLAFPLGEGWSSAGDDIAHGLLCAEALGARVEKGEHLLRLMPSGHEALGGVLPVGEAGFLGRVGNNSDAKKRPESPPRDRSLKLQIHQGTRSVP